MSKKITISLVALLVCAAGVLTAYAHEDDYIVGLSAFRDGLYEISAPTLESYLSGKKEKRKADYAHYLLYRMYLAEKKYKSSVKHLKELDGVKDRRFDDAQMVKDKMFLLINTDCGEAKAFLSAVSDESSINYFLDSKCELDKESAKAILANTKSSDTKLKVVSRFSDEPEMVGTIFDSLDVGKLNPDSKKYFALYFYKNNDMERFQKVSAIYEDEDIAGLELDRLWQSGDKDSFISGYEKYKEKYKLKGANACRAIDIYKNKGVQFDCNIINECMQKYSVDFVKVKGACLVKAGDKDMLTEFIDSLKPTIFPGMCSYGEYIFYNEMYLGAGHSKFYQCDEKYKIADVLLKKGENQAVVNMFFKKDGDRDKYYTATALRNLGKKEAADSIASQIGDEELKAKYNGGV